MASDVTSEAEKSGGPNPYNIEHFVTTNRVELTCYTLLLLA